MIIDLYNYYLYCTYEYKRVTHETVCKKKAAKDSIKDVSKVDQRRWCAGVVTFLKSLIVQ